MEVRNINQAFNAGERTHIPLSGRYLRLIATVNPITLEVGQNGVALAKISSIEAGIAVRLRPDQAEFTDIWITTAGAEQVVALVSDGDVTYDRTFIQYAQARTLTQPASATVGVAEGVVLAAGNRSLVIFEADDANAGAIALGPAGLTLAGSPIVLGPGDVWREEIAAAASWSAIASVVGQTLRMMTAA